MRKVSHHGLLEGIQDDESVSPASEITGEIGKTSYRVDEGVIEAFGSADLHGFHAHLTFYGERWC
jgi:hypothetical protein